MTVKTPLIRMEMQSGAFQSINGSQMSSRSVFYWCGAIAEKWKSFLDSLNSRLTLLRSEATGLGPQPAGKREFSQQRRV